MNKVSTLWTSARYVVAAVGAFFVGMQWADSDTIATLLSNLDTVIASVGVIGAAAAGIYKTATGK